VTGSSTRLKTSFSRTSMMAISDEKRRSTSFVVVFAEGFEGNFSANGQPSEVGSTRMLALIASADVTLQFVQLGIRFGRVWAAACML
jgi:hypothetical protein